MADSTKTFIRTKTAFRFGVGADSIVVPHEFIGPVPAWVLKDDNFMLGLRTGDISMVGEPPVTAVDKEAFEAAVQKAVDERMAAAKAGTTLTGLVDAKGQPLKGLALVNAEKKAAKEAAEAQKIAEDIAAAEQKAIDDQKVIDDAAEAQKSADLLGE